MERKIERKVSIMITRYIEQRIGKVSAPYKGGSWCYEDGILMHAFYVLYKKTGRKGIF